MTSRFHHETVASTDKETGRQGDKEKEVPGHLVSLSPCLPVSLSSSPPGRPLSLYRNFSWSLAGNVIYSVCQWGILMTITRLGSPEMLGQFALGLAVTTPVLAFGNLKAKGVQASDARREYHFRHYFGLALVMTALGLVVIAGIALASGYSRETSLVILVVALGKAFDVLADVFFGFYQQIEEMDRIAHALVANGLLSLAGLTAGIFLTGSMVWGVTGWTLAKGVILAGYSRGARKKVRSEERGSEEKKPGYLSPHSSLLTPHSSHSSQSLSKLAWLTLPLCFAALLLSLNANVPRYFIEHYQGEKVLGYFAAMAFLLLPGTSVLIAALGQAASPRLAHYYAAGDIRAFRTLLLRLAAVGALGGGLALLVVLVAGRKVLALLYTPEYAEHADVFLWLTLEAGLGFLSSILVYGMTAARFFRAQLLLSLATLAFTTVACAALTPRYGLFGAALATVLAGLFQLAGNTFVISYAVRELLKRGARGEGRGTRKNEPFSLAPSP